MQRDGLAGGIGVFFAENDAFEAESFGGVYNTVEAVFSKPVGALLRCACDETRAGECCGVVAVRDFGFYGLVRNIEGCA